jgi:hypothetical protein
MFAVATDICSLVRDFMLIYPYDTLYEVDLPVNCGSLCKEGNLENEICTV